MTLCKILGELLNIIERGKGKDKRITHHCLPKNAAYTKIKYTKSYTTQWTFEVQWTSIERPYCTCGRPKRTFNGRLVDVPNETQLVRPNRTKMDVHFRPSRDAMHGTWTSFGLPQDVY